MTKKDKIIACYGHIRQVSIAKMFNVTDAYVCQVHKEQGLINKKVHPQRTLDAWLK